MEVSMLCSDCHVEYDLTFACKPQEDDELSYT